MTTTELFPVEEIKKSRLGEVALENLGFGKVFSDYMLEANYADGEWKSVVIKPFGPLSLSPSLAALHYGQAIFEGVKAYKMADGKIGIFRPDENFKRFNISAARMNMPQVPEEIFLGGLKQLVELDKDWVPSGSDYSMYIRPFMFSTDDMLGVRPSDSYTFIILLSPSAPYFAAPMKILVEENYTRAATGGVGFAKNAGNYGASMIAATEAKKHGFDQVLWTDASEHKWLQEVGMMNVFFKINNEVVTPSLEEGTILHGITRKSVITLLQEMGMPVTERKINIDNVVAAYKAGTLQEVFGTGTAAVIAPIQLLHYKGLDMPMNIDSYETSKAIRQQLEKIRSGEVADSHGWMTIVG